MASVLNTAFIGFLCRRNCLHKQIINKIRKCTGIKSNERSSESNEIIETLSPLLNTSDLSQDLCFRVRNDMINKHSISEQAVDTRVLAVCAKEQKFEIAKAYVKCLESNGYSLNIYALATYLQSYDKATSISSSEENEIINIFNRIQKECEYMPTIILKNCIVALCRTHKWKIALELIKDKEVFKEIHSYTLAEIITAAFKHGDTNTGLTLLYDMNDNYQGDSSKYPHMYDAYLNYYLQEKPAEFDKAITKIFTFWRKHDIVPPQCIIDNVISACGKVGWEANYVTITRNGECHRCGNRLTEIVKNDKAFKQLAKDIVSKAIVKSDIFEYTTPEELNKFKNFIHKTQPYDIVIDGLNVSFCRQGSTWINDIIHHFLKENKKILVIARHHMYPKYKWMLPMTNVYVYFLQNETVDDPYIIYATLVSGSEAKFVTFDLLRQHSHKLGSKKQKLFKRWQYTHQYSWFYNKSTNKLNLIEPWSYEPYTQCNNEHWHIPYRLNSEMNKLLYKPVDTWICLHNPKK